MDETLRDSLLGVYGGTVCFGMDKLLRTNPDGFESLEAAAITGIVITAYLQIKEDFSATKAIVFGALAGTAAGMTHFSLDKVVDYLF